MMVSLGRWWRSVTCWRVLTLVLVALPQVLTAHFPELPDSDAGAIHDEAVVAVEKLYEVTYTPPPLLEQWLEYVAESGLVVLLPAVVFVLPRRYARPGTRWAAGILAVLGAVDGYLGMSALEHNDTAGSSLLFLSPFYLLAAGALVLSERQHRPETSEPATS
ncbi:hypothetical protein NDR87_35780 [Nocardia sp. CDC159]|uniref:Uncharacterized protein n=1 Tax=Nocardia pulmonis TaxID=2951408 RepID=A0A9X2EHN1_9NOCA|nr:MULTISPECIES: hypothetical protein [Nocardia]MCM6778848.1 hypothetical protein [Nocardia pulmonis]MCM6791737.1 hypothetical protein [Nocardia sp. CDC159]